MGGYWFCLPPLSPPPPSQNSAGCLIFISQRQTHVVLSIFQPQQYHNRTDQSSGCYADFHSAKTILFQILNRISILSSVSISFSFLLIPLSHHMTFFTFISLCHTYLAFTHSLFRVLASIHFPQYCSPSLQHYIAKHKAKPNSFPTLSSAVCLHFFIINLI